MLGVSDKVDEDPVSVAYDGAAVPSAVRRTQRRCLVIKFNGDSIFGEAPARLTIGPCGRHGGAQPRLSPFSPGSQAVGPLELTLKVVGRLVVDTDAELDGYLGYLNSLLTHPPLTATVSDDTRREMDQHVVRALRAHRPIERGRRVSLGFEATFVRFLTP